MEDIHRFTASLIVNQMEKEKRFKTMQSNIEEYDHNLDKVLDPIDWGMMEAIRDAFENKLKLSVAIPNVKKKIRGT